MCSALPFEFVVAQVALVLRSPAIVLQCRRDFPHLLFSLNGGVQTCHEAKSAVLYDGPWPTPGHVDPRDPSHQQQQQQQGRSSTDGSAAASTSKAAPEQPAATASCGCAAEELGSPPARASNAHFTPDAAAAEQAAEVPAYRHIEAGIIEGVMIGRAAYNDPWGCLSDADRAVFGEPENAVRTRREVSVVGRQQEVGGEVGWTHRIRVVRWYRPA